MKDFVSSLTSNLKPFFFGVATIAALVLFAGYNRESVTVEREKSAMTEGGNQVRATVCAAQGRATQGAVATLEEIRTYQQRGHVKEQPWAQIPGGEGEVSSEVATLCATMMQNEA